MVDGGIEKGAVVADKDEAWLVAEIARHGFATGEIEMVCGLVDKRKGRFVQKEPGKEQLRLLAAGEGYQVLYDLSRRCREYLNTGIQNVLRVGELEFAVRPVAENADEYLLEALVYLLKAVEEARLDVLGEVGD